MIFWKISYQNGLCLIKCKGKKIPDPTDWHALLVNASDQWALKVEGDNQRIWGFSAGYLSSEPWDSSSAIFVELYGTIRAFAPFSWRFMYWASDHIRYNSIKPQRICTGLHSHYQAFKNTYWDFTWKGRRFSNVKDSCSKSTTSNF